MIASVCLSVCLSICLSVVKNFSVLDVSGLHAGSKQDRITANQYELVYEYPSSTNTVRMPSNACLYSGISWRPPFRLL